MNRTLKTLLALGAVSAALSASIAIAQPATGFGGRGQGPCMRTSADQTQALPATPRGRAQDHFRIADANKDGLLSRDEARTFPGFANRFDALDKNGDGQVSADELLAMQMTMRGQGKTGQGQMGMNPGGGQGRGGMGQGRMGRGPMWQS